MNNSLCKQPVHLLCSSLLCESAHSRPWTKSPAAHHHTPTVTITQVPLSIHAAPNQTNQAWRALTEITASLVQEPSPLTRQITYWHWVRQSLLTHTLKEVFTTQKHTHMYMRFHDVLLGQPQKLFQSLSSVCAAAKLIQPRLWSVLRDINRQAALQQFSVAYLSSSFTDSSFKCHCVTHCCSFVIPQEPLRLTADRSFS